MARPRDEDKRQAILSTALEVFGEHGFTSTTVKDIADRAGVAPGSIYTYFQDKEDLFRATVERGWRELLDEIESLKRTPQEPAVSLRRLIDVGMNLLKKACPLLRGMLFDSRRMDLLNPYLQELYGAVDGLIQELGRRGVLEVLREGRRRLAGIKVIVLGTMLAAALAREEEFEQEFENLRSNLVEFVRRRTGPFSAAAEGWS
jgi:AcrR family transcriptional regulator